MFAELFAQIDQRLAERDQRRNALFARHNAAMEVYTSEVPPTIDRDGRAHAPCDGYVYPVDPWGEQERTFHAGSYLPEFYIDEDGEWWPSSGEPRFTRCPRFQCPMVLIDALREKLEDTAFRVNHGKSWDYRGVQVAYVYFEGLSRVLTNDLRDMIADVALDYLGEIRAKAIKQMDDRFNCEVIEGKLTIEGEILTIKEECNMFGVALKMLIGDDRGFKVWGTMPRAIEDDDNCQRGSKVRFIATVQRSETDASFGFFKRPTKAEVL